MALVQGNAIVFFRIQDHLRNMGLGRDALKALHFGYKKLDNGGYANLVLDEDFPDAKRIRHLFASIKGSG